MHYGYSVTLLWRFRIGHNAKEQVEEYEGPMQEQET